MPNDITDVNNFSGRLQTQFELVDEMDCEADRRAIKRWGNTQDVADTTLIDRLKNVRLMSDRSDQRLVDMDKGDILTLLADFGSGTHSEVPDSGLGDGTMRQYRQAARLFFRDELDRDWAEDITIGQPERSPIGPDQILTGEEVDDLLDASKTPRDSALIAFLCVTGQRITAALSIRVGDVELNERTASIRLNDDAKGLKGAGGPRPLLWARSYVASWLDVHPARDDGDAPLFCAVQGGSRPREDGGTVTWAPGDPLSRSQVHNRLKAVAKRGGVDTEKVKPHNFRHTAITRMRDQGIPDDRIRFMVGVEPDSDILERYDKATNEKMMRRLRDDHDIETEGDLNVGQPTLDNCRGCGAPLRGAARYCPQCGTPLNVNAADDIDDMTESMEDTIPKLAEKFDGETLRELLKAKRLLDDPDIRDALNELDH